MNRLTMQGVADLAQVKRPVVSMWRSRYAHGLAPFPLPITTGEGGQNTFDASEVVEWLQQTGHGNNPEVHIEAVLHSDLMARLRSDLYRSSVLLLLQHWYGSSLAELQCEEVLDVLARTDAPGIAEVNDVLHALSDESLRDTVDQLAEAAFGGAAVLDRIVSSFTSTRGVWRDQALTRAAQAFFSEVLGELLASDSCVIVPEGVGGMVLAGTLVGEYSLQGQDRVVVAPPVGSLPTPEVVTAWRRIAAHGQLGDPMMTGSESVCRLLMLTNVGASQFFATVADSLVELGRDDVLIVVGPAPLMIGVAGASERRQLLVPHPEYLAPLRFVAQLPRGLTLTGGRAQLAIWVFGNTDSEWTVFGDHSDARTLDARAIAADISASMSSRSDVRAHAFTRSTVRMSIQALRSEDLAAILPRERSVEGSEHLATIWQVHRGVLDGIELEATPAKLDRIAFAEAARWLGRDLPGARISAEFLEPPGPGIATVVGPDEVRDPDSEYRRGIHRLTLERVVPRAQYTEPGDVIYVAQNGPAAIVDRIGGNVVLAPARVFRCEPRIESARRLSPIVVAADIARMRTADRRDWRLRTVQADRAAGFDDAFSRIDTRRAELLAEIKDIEVLSRSLIDGLAEGTLSPGHTDMTDPPQHEKAE